MSPAWAAPRSSTSAEPPQPAKPRPAPKPMGAAVMASSNAQQSAAGEEPPADPQAEPATSSAPPPPVRPSMSPPRPVGKVALPTKVDPKTGQRIVSITNLDLERIYGRSVVPVSSATRSPDTGAGEGFVSSAETPLEAPAAAGAASAGDAARVAEINAELGRLNRNELGIVNPFLPPPKLSDAEKAAMQGKDNRQRLDMTKQRIQELEQEKARLESSPSGENRSGR